MSPGLVNFTYLYKAPFSSIQMGSMGFKMHNSWRHLLASQQVYLCLCWNLITGNPRARMRQETSDFRKSRRAGICSHGNKKYHLGSQSYWWQHTVRMAYIRVGDKGRGLADGNFICDETACIGLPTHLQLIAKLRPYLVDCFRKITSYSQLPWHKNSTIPAWRGHSIMRRQRQPCFTGRFRSNIH